MIDLWARICGPTEVGGSRFEGDWVVAASGPADRFTHWFARLALARSQ